MILEGRNVICQGGGVRVVLRIFYHSLGGQPGDSVPSNIVVFKRSVELRDEVSESSEGERGA